MCVRGEKNKAIERERKERVKFARARRGGVSVCLPLMDFACRRISVACGRVMGRAPWQRGNEMGKGRGAAAAAEEDVVVVEGVRSRPPMHLG